MKSSKVKSSEHVGALLREAGDGFDQIVGRVVELAHLAVVDVAQVVAIGEGQPDAGALVNALLAGHELNAAGELGVDDEGMIAGQGNEQEFTAPADGEELAADGVVGERIGQGADDAGSEHLGLGYGPARQAGAEELDGDLEFGGFRHGHSPPGQ